LIAAAAAMTACRPSAKVDAGPEASAPGKTAPESGPKVEPGPEPESERAPPARAEKAHGLPDVGIWADLDGRVQFADLPEPAGPRTLVVDRERGVATLYAGGWPLKAYPLDGSATLRVEAEQVKLRPGDAAQLEAWLGPDDLRVLPRGARPWPGDRDDDGIVDPLDVVLGARKADLNDARYDPEYVAIPSPGGDVPREQGVCTDVIVRALRNAGLDLQGELAADIARAPRSYPMVKEANDDIDHRRVKTILPWFRRHLEAHTLELDEAEDPYRPGDIVFMDTIPSRSGPDHIGVVSDVHGDDGELLVINNWDTGSTTDSLSLLGRVEVTHRFRLPARMPAPIPAEATQLVTVRADGWADYKATLRRYERTDRAGPWRAVGDPIEVVLGAKGLAWGQGLHGRGAPGDRGGPVKVEGDLKSPAGVFGLGRAFGTVAGVEAAGERVTPSSTTLRCVDDPSSVHYGRVVDADQVEVDWDSAEKMRQAAYRVAVTVEHNTAPSRPGFGSCIFLHQWRSSEDPVSGCSAMAGARLDEVVRWLNPESAVYVALPRAEYDALADAWQLPG